MLDFDLGVVVLSLCCFQWLNTSTSKRTSQSSFCSGLWSSQKNNILMGMSKSIWSWFLAAETLWMWVRWRKPDGKVVSWFWERFTCHNLKHRTEGGDSFLETKKAALKSSRFCPFGLKASFKENVFWVFFFLFTLHTLQELQCLKYLGLFLFQWAWLHEQTHTHVESTHSCTDTKRDSEQGREN